MSNWKAEVSLNDKEFWGAGCKVWLDVRRELVQYMGNGSGCKSKGILKGWGDTRIHGGENGFAIRRL